MEIAGVAQSCLAVVDEDVGAAGDVPGVEERDLVTRRLEGFAVAVSLFDLPETGDVSFGEGTLHRAAVQFQRVTGQNPGQFGRRRRPVNLGPARTRQQGGHRTDVIEVAVRNDDCVGLDVANGILRRRRRQRPVIEQQTLVDEDRTPADFLGSAEKLHVH